MAQNEAAGSFGEGFANALGSDIQQRSKAKLELAMLSKRIEMENQARMAQMQAEAQLKQVPADQVSRFSNALGTDIDTSGLGQGLNAGASDTFLKGAAELGAANLQRKMMMMGKMTNNQPMYNDQTGQKVGERAVTLFGPGEPHQYNTATDDVKQGRELISFRDDLLRLRAMLNGQDTGPVTGRLKEAMVNAGYSPDSAGVTAVRAAATTALPKVLAGFNRFNEPEIQRLSIIPPGLTNVQDVNNALFDNAFATVDSHAQSLGMGQKWVDQGKANPFDMKQYISPQGRQLFYNQGQGQPQPQAQPQAAPGGLPPMPGQQAQASNPFMGYGLADMAAELGRQHANHSKVRLQNAKMIDQANGQ